MRDQTSGKMIRFYYTSLQFLYWMMFCSVYGFATLFLIYFKIDPAKIGGILALVNIVSTVLQPFISQVIIKKRKIPLITVLKTMIAGLGVILLAGVLIPNLPIITYILGGILVVSMQSFLNALAFEYSNTGYRTFHTMINSFLAQIFENIHGGSKEVGIALMIAALCELPGMIFFEQLVKKKSSKFWLSVASISFAVRGFMMLLASSILMMEMTHLLQAFSFALFIPASAYLFNQFLADDDRVFGQTMIIIATTLGGVIGNVLGGSLLQHFGVWEMLIFGTGFAVLGALLTILGIRKIPKLSEDSGDITK